MKRIFAVLCILAVFFPAIIFASDIAVIPYKIENPGEKFPISKGVEFAKYMGVGASIVKGFDYYPFSQTVKDLDDYGIQPEKSLSLEQLQILSKSRMIDYVISGTIVKTDSGYIVKSILFSRHAGKIISRSTTKSYSFKKLAEKDIDNLFTYFISPKNNIAKSSYSQTLFIVDNSFLCSREMPKIKSNILSLSSALVNNYKRSEFFLLQYYGKSSFSTIRTINGLEKNINSISTNHKSAESSFDNILSDSIKRIPWNNTSIKNIVIITNSSIKKSSYLNFTISKAAALKIKINFVLLGRVSESSNIVYSSIAQKTEGIVKDVTYSQTLFDHRGNSYTLYYERSRLFISDSKPSKWQEGVLIYRGASRFSSISKVSYVKELLVQSNSAIKDPYALSEYFKRNGNRPVVKSDYPENNISYIFNKVLFGEMISKDHKPIARVQLYYFKASIWIDVYSEEDLKYYLEKKESGISFIAGLRLLKNNSSVYGFSPASKVFYNFKREQLPVSLMLNLDELLKNPEKYSKEGFLNPPIWFSEVKVGEIIVKRDVNDIRN